MKKDLKQKYKQRYADQCQVERDEYLEVIQGLKYELVGIQNKFQFQMEEVIKLKEDHKRELAEKDKKLEEAYAAIEQMKQI